MHWKYSIKYRFSYFVFEPLIRILIYSVKNTSPVLSTSIFFFKYRRIKIFTSMHSIFWYAAIFVEKRPLIFINSSAYCTVCMRTVRDINLLKPRSLYRVWLNRAAALLAVMQLYMSAGWKIYWFIHSWYNRHCYWGYSKLNNYVIWYWVVKYCAIIYATNSLILIIRR